MSCLKNPVELPRINCNLMMLSITNRGEGIDVCHFEDSPWNLFSRSQFHLHDAETKLLLCNFKQYKQTTSTLEHKPQLICDNY